MIVKILTASGWQMAEQLELFPGRGLSLLENALAYGDSNYLIKPAASSTASLNYIKTTGLQVVGATVTKE